MIDDPGDPRNLPRWRPALLGVQREGGKVQCRLCPFLCIMPDGRAGSCEVRRNHDGRLVTEASSVAHVDRTPVERKPLYHVRPGSMVITATGNGCTFRCNYCINHSLSQYGRLPEVVRRSTGHTATELAREAEEAGAALGLSYAEPALALELALDLAAAGRPRGVPLVWKSNGFLTPEAVDLVAPVLDAVNIDVKAADERAHRELTGAPLAPVWDTIVRMREAGVWVEVSTPLVPGTASEPHQWRAIAAEIAAIDPDLPWHLIRFTPDFRMTAAVPTPPADLADAARIGREAGLRYVYVERALGDDGRRTRCPNPRCGRTVVDRGIWRTRSTRLSADGRCLACDTPIPGRWATPGAPDPRADSATGARL
jgi:pyruvate formate lyase activating enzyme